MQGESPGAFPRSILPGRVSLGVQALQLCKREESKGKNPAELQAAKAATRQSGKANALTLHATPSLPPLSPLAAPESPLASPVSASSSPSTRRVSRRGCVLRRRARGCCCISPSRWRGSGGVVRFGRSRGGPAGPGGERRAAVGSGPPLGYAKGTERRRYECKVRRKLQSF